MSPSVPVRLLLSQSDERLVGYARAGHERAFEALVQRYRRQLLAYCRRLLLSEQRAEDALQQALLQAWVALRNGNEVSEPRAWLYRIVHNAAINTLRTSRYDYCQLSESLSGADAPQDDLDRRIAVREALAGLAALPEMQREALLRTAIEGRTHQQAANELGVSEPALRGLVYRARVTMRAAAGAIVPPPLISWALEAGTRGTPVLERVAGLGTGGGSAGLAGLLIKGSAAAVTAGALAGSIVASHPHHASAYTNRPSAKPARRTDAESLASTATARPVAFISPGTTRATHRQRHTNGITTVPLLQGPRRARHRRHNPITTQRPIPTASPPAAATNWQPPPASHQHHGDRKFQPTNVGGPSGHDGSNSGSQRDSGGGAQQSDGDGRQPRHDDGGHNDGSGEHDGGSGGSGTNQSGQSDGEARTSNNDSRDGKDSSTGGSDEWQSGGGSDGGGGGKESTSGTEESSQQPDH